MPATTEQKQRQLALYALARMDMDGARWVAWYMIREDITERSGYLDVMLTGIIVAYARPFTRTRAPWGSLPERFSRFENEDFTRTHRQILDWRNRVFAHNDQNEYRNVVVLPAGTGLDDTPAAAERRALFTAADLKAIMLVAQEQERRLKEAVTDLVVELYPGKFKPGTILELDGTPIPTES